MKKIECYSCQFETNCKEYDSHDMYGKVTDKKWLCELCASTMAGASLDWKHSEVSTQQLIQAICYVGNTILQRIEKLEASQNQRFTTGGGE